ncbi:DUF4143 domain-containing protein [Herbiconiux sp. 11R-BC]|uniref:DUF4143 domain-containing protein n=1 Tax=Herbiconiux sp. 11R-BC TaxID=3111637 RepID=UPI003C2CED4F
MRANAKAADPQSPFGGGFVEGFVIGELAKWRAWSRKDYTLTHYRDNHGRKIDVVLEDRRREVVGALVDVPPPRAAIFHITQTG